VRHARILPALLVFLSACGGNAQAPAHQNNYQRAAIEMARGFGHIAPSVKITAVVCGHIHAGAATCTVRDSSGGVYRCDVQVGNPIYSETGCVAKLPGKR
jgi:hypothetical protein